MRLFLSILLLTGCKQNIDYKCFNGYVMTDPLLSDSAICSHYSENTQGVIGYNCYAVSGASTKAKYEIVFFKNYKIYYTKCYNLETN